jgi:hypothetical protein
MRLRILVIAMACGLVGLSGCGGGDDSTPPQPVVTQILSDPTFDGDIEQTSPASFVITQGMSASVQSVLAGIDPVGGTEFRAFLDFPLSGAGGVPADAVIDSAFLEFYVDDLQPITSGLPIRIDLVAFQPPTLIDTDFDPAIQPALASVTVFPDISRQDVGNFVPVDVTSLMAEAQRRKLVDFQVRIQESNLGPAVPALMIVDDSTGPNRATRAPLLTVTYF